MNTNLLWLIPILPFVGFLLNGTLGRKLPRAVVTSIALLFTVLPAVIVAQLWMYMKSAGAPLALSVASKPWIAITGFQVNFAFTVDHLTLIMLGVVTGVGFLIHIYSAGYMAHEEGYWRFFAYLNLFMFFMLVLVLAQNYLVLFVGWEGVGLCSYLLIGFYFTEQFATTAGNKAFIVNRIGDFGFSLAMFLIVKHFGSLDFTQVFGKAQNMTAESVPFFAICMLLLVGACGKSAQIPLYVWLPDAMAGPTPVSALIHAATMVTAGVYMIARSSVLFAHAPGAMDWVAAIGTATAFLAATIGLAQTDIKKVFAYSTVSQLGYMFMGVGVGAYSAGIFHLMTHAFFKALLFLGAGSVIHALGGEQDLRQMGGLAKRIPITCVVLFCAGVAIAGLPFTSGAMSKDLILEAAYQRSPILYWIGVITACMTAFYVFRALFLAFFGEYRGHAHHVHEAPFVMWAPLAVLAALSLAGGFLSVPQWLEPMFPLHEGHVEPLIAYLPFAAGFIGIGIAWWFYVLSPKLPDSIASGLGGLYKLVLNKYFVDEAYNGAVVQPLIQGSRTVLWRFVDVTVIDGTVNGVGKRSRGVGNILRLLQSGNIRNYAAWVVFGSVILLIAIGLSGGWR